MPQFPCRLKATVPLRRILMDKALMAVMGLVLGLGVVMVVAGMAQAAPPQYACPICGTPFWTYDELYGHFTAEHPAEPIDIIWE
ncbi:hypothetical protein ES708_00234 [subsurface metagenome]